MAQSKTILITGATSGIGEGLALHYLKVGHKVGVCGRDERRLRALCAEHPQAFPLQFDVTDRDEARRKIGDFIRSQGELDLAILNAGDHKPTDGADFCAGAYANLMNINYLGLVHCLEPVIAVMKRQNDGLIALTGSLAGYTGLTHAGAYCASKSAVMRLAETLQVELAGAGIDVRLISPGFVKTPLTDQNDFAMPFLMERDEAVSRIVKGLEKRGFEIAFPRRLAWSLRILSMLPRPLYFRALKGMLREDR